MPFLSWFEGIFEATSDKARLVTVLLSAFIAITVVLINQSLTNRREKLTLKITKTEELYMATISFNTAITSTSDAMSKLNKLALSEQKNHKIEIENHNESYTKIYELIQLHVEAATQAFQKIHLIKNLYLREIYISRKQQYSTAEILHKLAEYSYEDDESAIVYISMVTQLLNYSRFIMSECVKLTEQDSTIMHRVYMKIKRLKRGPDISDSMAKYPD